MSIGGFLAAAASAGFEDAAHILAEKGYLPARVFG
jgi:hypothetical protein